MDGKVVIEMCDSLIGDINGRETGGRTSGTVTSCCTSMEASESLATMGTTSHQRFSVWFGLDEEHDISQSI